MVAVVRPGSSRDSGVLARMVSVLSLVPLFTLFHLGVLGGQYLVLSTDRVLGDWEGWQGDALLSLMQKLMHLLLRWWEQFVKVALVVLVSLLAEGPKG